MCVVLFASAVHTQPYLQAAVEGGGQDGGIVFCIKYTVRFVTISQFIKPLRTVELSHKTLPKTTTVLSMSRKYI